MQPIVNPFTDSQKFSIPEYRAKFFLDITKKSRAAEQERRK